MNEVNFVQRALTSKETEQVNSGFDNLSLEEGILLESNEPISVVALSKDTFVGCATGLAHKNGETYSGWFFLSDLFIAKEHRNKGIGSNLLKELEHKIKPLGIRHIWLWTSGSASLRFYARHGYTQFTEMENWYSDGSSRIGLRKTLID